MKKTPPVKSPLAALAAVICICANPEPAPAAPVQASGADDFVASTAVVTQWAKPDANNKAYVGVYMSKFDELSGLLIDSGIRHIRDTGNSDDFIKKIQRLADAGVKSVITLSPAAGIRPGPDYWAQAPKYNNASTSIYNIDDFIRRAGRDAVAYVEMNSSLDTAARRSATFWHPSDTATLSDSPSSEFYYINYIKAATATVKARLAADPALADIPLIGPSFTTIATGDGSAYAAAGDLGESVDFSNIQHYYLGLEPETATERGVDFAVENASEVQAPGGGRAVTEGGESHVNGTQKNIWPPVVQGRYVPRYYLAHFLKGFSLIAAQELVDVDWTHATTPPGPTTVKADNFGLIQNDLTPKPAYTAMKNLLSVLKDPGPAFEAGPLDYAMTGATDNVCAALFQKRNGDFYLCLWLGLASYNPVSGDMSDNPPQTVSITVPESIQGARVFTLDDAGVMTAADTPISAGAVSVSVTDRVTIVRLSATAAGGAASVPAGLRTDRAGGQITLKWAPVFEAASYIIKRATAADGAFEIIASGVTATEYVDTDVTDGAAVYYTVTAAAPGGESAASAPVSAVPYKPIIDNMESAPAVTKVGAWNTSLSPSYSTNFPADYYGTNTVIDNSSPKTQKSFTFTPAISAAGAYDVYSRWTASGNRADNIPIDITHADGTFTTTVNQKVNGGAWILLGTFNFDTGASGNLTIRNDNTIAGSVVVADAVRFDIAPPRPPAGLTATAGTPPV
ncbi:MAG: hypothetical protein LBC18_16460, partial [Opitutaceae bacterium]|nr:hypothetical protein [Opitutaceae bacterium]